MRATAALALLCLASTASAAAAHRYTPAERYEGCMFGETIPLMRRGTDRERALTIASDRCVAWSVGLTPSDIQQVDIDLHRELDRSERLGL